MFKINVIDLTNMQLRTYITSTDHLTNRSFPVSIQLNLICLLIHIPSLLLFMIMLETAKIVTEIPLS